MPGLGCSTCNVVFEDEGQQKVHYRTDWHRYNLKRKVAGVPGVSEILFNVRAQTLAADQKKLEGDRLLYKCTLCGKEYSTEKAHSQHLQSKAHISKASSLEDSSGASVAVVRPAPAKSVREVSGSEKGNSSRLEEEDSSDSSDEEWEEIGHEEGKDSIMELRRHGEEAGPNDDVMYDEWEASRCFICDYQPDGTIEGCVEHLHKVHGFFIPDAEFLKDPEGLLSYLGLKVTKGFMCLFCDERGKRFQSLEAVRKHMISKSHCKLRQGDGDVMEEELDEFYDFTSSYVDSDETQIMKAKDAEESRVSLVSGGLELFIKSDGADGTVSKTIGSRELFRYYKQRPPPSDQRDGIAVNAVIAKYRSMGLATQNPDYKASRKAGVKSIPSQRLEAFRSKVALSNNVNWNLPKNCTH